MKTAEVTNDTLLFQHVLSNSGCMEWAALTVARHVRYCFTHQIDYRLIVGDVPPQMHRPGHYTVPQLILGYLEAGYQNVIYLDADCIIIDLQTDLRAAFVKDKIGAVWHNLSFLTPDQSHFNVGALYVSNTPAVMRFVRKWMLDRPGSPRFPWWENGSFNIMGKRAGIINRLDNAWNAGHVSPSEKPIVLGLHGFPDRLEAIRAKMLELEPR